MDCTEVLNTLKSVIGQSDDFVSLHEPTFVGKEWDYVKECLDTGWVSSVGSYVDRFEEMLAEYTGVKRAVAVVNGTAALHICLKLAGVEADDEVLLPTLTFVATPNAVSYCGAIPHFVDSDEATLGLDPGKLADYLTEIVEMRSGECVNRITGRRIKAVVPMHTYGHPVDLDALVKFHKSHGKLATMTAVRPTARYGHLELDGRKVVEFSEKPQTAEGWINGAFFVLEPGIFDYIDGDDIMWEQEPLERLANEGQLMAYSHDSFWQCMDTLREKHILETLWQSGEAPWKTW